MNSVGESETNVRLGRKSKENLGKMSLLKHMRTEEKTLLVWI